jgi:hypothetical protein
MREVMSPGGRICCFVPAFPFLFGALDEQLGHFRRYRRQELAAKTSEAGLRVVDLYHVNMIGWPLWLVNGRLLRSTGQGRERAVAIYDRFLVPVARALEGRARPPFGQSLMLVAERP